MANVHTFPTFYVLCGEDGCPIFGSGTLANFEAAYIAAQRTNGLLFIDLTDSAAPVFRVWDSASSLWAV